MRALKITSKSEYLAEMAKYSKYIGSVVVKRSGKPFKSKSTMNTVCGMCINPNSMKIAYIFDEDESIVDCHMCRLEHAPYKRARDVTIYNKASESYSDYEIGITNDDRGGIGNFWDQQIQMNYGHLSGWSPGIPGTMAVRLTDNGDGITFVMANNEFTLDYDEFAMVHAMMLYYHNESKLDDKPLSYHFTKQKK